MSEHSSSDIAFTAAVKAVQARKGSRRAYAKMETQGGFETEVTPDLVAFLAQPYAQHRGGPKGFIRALDQKTLGFADYTGNRQYISTGNLSENDKAFLILIDYAHRRRVKVWGNARVVEGDAALMARLAPEASGARPEQAILFSITAWDVNCPQHIPQKIDAADVTSAVSKLQDRVAALETENTRLRAEASAAAAPFRPPGDK
jgi:uncharacterized protein